MPRERDNKSSQVKSPRAPKLRVHRGGGGAERAEAREEVLYMADNSAPELVALYALFVSIVIVCFVGVLLLIRKAHPPALPASALFLVALLSSTYAAAASGVLKHWEVLPPPPAIIMVLLVCLNCCLCFCTELGLQLSSLPLSLLVGTQSFRIAVEVWLHCGKELRVVPPQLAWGGRNFDVATGVLAAVLGVWSLRTRPPDALLWIYNSCGLAVLINVVVTAVLSLPTRMQHFHPSSEFIVEPPFVWLPTWLVQCAFAGQCAGWTRRTARPLLSY